jgi:ABC-type xylose transport system permease subunit
VIFKIDYVVAAIGNKEFGSVFLQPAGGKPENIAVAVVAAGWAKVCAIVHCFWHVAHTLTHTSRAARGVDARPSHLAWRRRAAAAVCVAALSLSLSRARLLPSLSGP